MRPENKRMQDFLRENGIDAVAKYFPAGSCKHSWRLYGVTGEKDENGRPAYQKWWGNESLINKMNALGFTDLWHEPLKNSSGNGGVFSVMVRGHYELLECQKNDAVILTKQTREKPETRNDTGTSRELRRQIRLNKAAETNWRNCKRNGQPMYY